jgi:hypothetical protein
MLFKISCALSLGHARSVPSRSAHRRSAGRPRIPGAAHAVQVSRLQILKGLRLPRWQPLMSKGLECLTKPRYASLEWILAMPSGAPPIGAFAFPEASSK